MGLLLWIYTINQREIYQQNANPSGWVLSGQSLLPWLWVSTNDYVIRILSLTLATTAECIAKATAVQQKSLGSVAKVVLYHRIALDYLLAK